MTKVLLQRSAENVTSSNHSSSSSFLVENGETLWFACHCVVITCTLVDIYLFICLIAFWWRDVRNGGISNLLAKQAWYKNDSHFGSTVSRLATNNNNSTLQEQSIPQCTPFRVNSAEGRYRTWMVRFSLFASFFSLLKFLLDELKFFYAWDALSDNACDVINDVTEIGLYGSTMLCVYAFLWTRQWMFYHNPAVKNLIYRQQLIMFSRYLPIAILSLVGVLAIFHIVPLRYVADTKRGKFYLGCVSTYHTLNPTDVWPIVLYVTFTSTFQLSLLSLFLYPLLRRKIDSYHKRIPNSPVPSPLMPRNYSFKPSVSFGDLATAKSQGKSLSSDSFLELPTLFSRGDNYATTTVSPLSPLRQAINQRHPRSDSIPSIRQVQDKSRRGTHIRIFNLSRTRKCRNSKINKQISTRQWKERHCKPQKKYTLSGRMRRSAKRTLIWTAMCLITDVTMVGVSLYFGYGTPLIFITAMNNFNIVVNQLCLIATYSGWKDIIFPMIRLLKLRKDRKAIALSRMSAAAHQLNCEGSQSKVDLSFSAAERPGSNNKRLYHMDVEDCQCSFSVDDNRRPLARPVSLPGSPQLSHKRDKHSISTL